MKCLGRLLELYPKSLEVPQASFGLGKGLDALPRVDATPKAQHEVPVPLPQVVYVIVRLPHFSLSGGCHPGSRAAIDSVLPVGSRHFVLRGKTGQQLLCGQLMVPEVFFQGELLLGDRGERSRTAVAQRPEVALMPVDIDDGVSSFFQCLGHTVTSPAYQCFLLDQLLEFPCGLLPAARSRIRQFDQEAV